jgi:hypothetical protein
LVEIQDSKGATHGRLVVHIATISDDPVLSLSLSLSLHLRLSVYIYRYRYRHICIIEIWFHSSLYIICGWHLAILLLEFISQCGADYC